MSNEENVLGKHIKRIRLSFGETLEEFGARLNPPASKSLVSKWERGVVMPAPARLKEIADFVNWPVNYLVSENIKTDNWSREEKLAVRKDLAQETREAIDDFTKIASSPELINLLSFNGKTLLSQAGALALYAESRLKKNDAVHIESALSAIQEWLTGLITGEFAIDESEISTNIKQFSELLSDSVERIKQNKQ